MSEAGHGEGRLASRAELRRLLIETYGPLLGGDDLARALGFRGMGALRQAKRQNRIGVAVFRPPARQTMCALTTDVADWLYDVRKSRGGEPCES